jgi:hypothetical protein
MIFRNHGRGELRLSIAELQDFRIAAGGFANREGSVGASLNPLIDAP